MADFSAEDKLKCLLMELNMRRRSYPRKVERLKQGQTFGGMTQDEMEWQIGCMEAIVYDYQLIADKIRGWGPTIK